jgi:hypothetical protein
MHIHSSCYTRIQLFQLRLSPEQSGKVEYERERLLGIANKFIHLAFRARIRLFRFARGTTLIEIAVYNVGGFAVATCSTIWPIWKLNVIVTSISVYVLNCIFSTQKQNLNVIQSLVYSSFGVFFLYF